MRHVLTALRSPTKSLTLNSSVGVATTTWYDVPAPIIVHCREFREDAERGRQEKGDKKEAEVVSSFPGKNTNVTSIDENMEAGYRGDDERVKFSARAMSIGGVWSSNNGVGSEALYQNNVEAALNSLSKVCVESSRLETNPESCQVNDNRNSQKRHSSTVELNATTTVMTDSDGVPTISFSFLRADEKFHNVDEEEVVILEVDTSDQTDCSPHQLYDLPKSAVVSNNRASLGQQEDDKEAENDSPSASMTRQDLYDVPKSAKQDVSRDEETADCNPPPKSGEARGTLDLLKRNQADQTKRSTRSLKSGRRSYGASDSDGYDAGIASMSGSYSDPECQNEPALSVSGGSERSKRLKLQKRRLGKAWGRMRNWLREERTKLGEVVNRHARLQAVGALNAEVVGAKSTFSRKKEENE